MTMFNQIQAVRFGNNSRFEYALESAGLRTGELARLSGPAIFLDRVSGNGRQYIPESVHAQVAELQPRIAKKALFGCLDHPPTDDIAQLAYVKMTDVSHRIDAIWFNEKEQTYYITITVLDTPNGRIMKTILDAGSPIYVSLRSLLDPARNRQMNGYMAAWMLALITIDCVSRPGFADAEMEPIDIASANESVLAVCESLNLFNSQRNFDMKQNRKSNKNRQYIPLIAMESIAGVATQPSKDFEDVVTAFLADVLDKLPGKFTASDFAAAYPNSVFGDSIIGLYEGTKELMIQDADCKTMAMISLGSDVDGEYMVVDDANIDYFNTEIASNSNDVQNHESATEGMYAIIATENFTPADDFVAAAQTIANALSDKYAEGFSMDEFNGEIAEMLSEEYNVSARIDSDEVELRIVDGDAKNGATIKLAEVDGKYIIEGVSEFWQPGMEAEVGDIVVIKDASGEEIVTGEIEACGKFGDLKETIESEDAEGYQNCMDANIEDDCYVCKINGDWYFVCDGVSCETAVAEPAVEGIEPGCAVKIIENDEVIDEGVVEECGVLGDMRDQINAEDEVAAEVCENLPDETEVCKVNGNWYAATDSCSFEPNMEPANENIDAVQQTDGNQNEPLKIDEKYMKEGDENPEDLAPAEIIDEDDEEAKKAAEQVAGQMAEVIEDGMAEIIDEEPEDKKDIKPEEEDATKQDQDDANRNEIAEEAQRIFSMPNSKFAGNYAIEHMPAMYKHIWGGLSDAAKATIAKQAEHAKVATESENLRFWSATNFIAVERACLATKGQIEAALESMQPMDPKTEFLKGLTNGVKLS